jgi:hypothetical protein
LAEGSGEAGTGIVTVRGGDTARMVTTVQAGTTAPNAVSE